VYDRYRPGPPPQALDWLLPAGCTSVLDLAAGTGLLSRRLLERFDDVVAVEPDPGMREVYAEVCPGATLLDGTGENIPLPDSRVDATLVSAAWHWMDASRALPEIARVLRPGGTLGLLWTRRDQRVPWVAELDAFVRDLVGGDDYVQGELQRLSGDTWLPDGAPFADETSRTLEWREEVPVESVVGVFRTYSWFIRQTEARKEEMAAEIEAYVRRNAELDGELVQLPMSCLCWRMRSVAD